MAGYCVSGLFRFGLFLRAMGLPGSVICSPVRLHFYQQLAAELRCHSRFALGVISSVKGSSPQKQGAKALFFPDDRIVGTLGGGCLEAEVRLRARHALASGEPATFDLTLDHDYGWDDGLICGGRVSGLILPRAAEAGDIWRTLAGRGSPRTWGVRDDFSIAWVDGFPDATWRYRETVAPPMALWIAGSGHIAQAVAPLAQDLDFAVTIFDDRPELANVEHFSDGTHFRVGAWNELLEEPMPPQAAMGLIVTRGHKHDATVLGNWLHRPFGFLGMIGSGRKLRLIRDGFVDKGLATPDDFARLACPVGLAIGAVSVHEIAVSILAQYIQKRAQLFAVDDVRVNNTVHA